MALKILIGLCLLLSGCATQRITEGGGSSLLATLVVQVENQTGAPMALGIVGDERITISSGQSATVEGNSPTELTLVASSPHGTAVRKYCPSYPGQREAWIVTREELDRQTQVGHCAFRRGGWGGYYASPRVSIYVGRSRGWRRW